jgi:Flp pilus assembly protein TadG
MAVVTPLLLTLVFGIIEFSWAMNVQQSLTNAAREGCRTAAIKGTTDQEVQDRVDEYLGATGLTTYWTDITRSTVGNPTESVTVSIYYGDISLVGGFFPGLEYKTLTATCSMRKEGV